MRSAILVIVSHGLCFAAEIRGTWVSRGSSTPSRLMVQMEQAGDRLVIFKLWTTSAGQRLERSAYTIDGSGAHRAAVRATRGGTEIRFPEAREIWTIAANGELAIRSTISATSLILKPAEEWVELRGGAENERDFGGGTGAGPPESSGKATRRPVRDLSRRFRGRGD